MKNRCDGSLMKDHFLSPMIGVDWTAWSRRLDLPNVNSWLIRQVQNRITPWRVPWRPQILSDLQQIISGLHSAKSHELSTTDLTHVAHFKKTLEELKVKCQEHDQAVVKGVWIPTLQLLDQELKFLLSTKLPAAQTALNEWCSQPAQFAAPFDKVDGLSVDQWISLWRDLCERSITESSN